MCEYSACDPMIANDCPSATRGHSAAILRQSLQASPLRSSSTPATTSLSSSAASSARWCRPTRLGGRDHPGVGATQAGEDRADPAGEPIERLAPVDDARREFGPQVLERPAQPPRRGRVRALAKVERLFADLLPQVRVRDLPPLTVEAQARERFLARLVPVATDNRAHRRGHRVEPLFGRQVGECVGQLVARDRGQHRRLLLGQPSLQLLREVSPLGEIIRVLLALPRRLPVPRQDRQRRSRRHRRRRQRLAIARGRGRGFLSPGRRRRFAWRHRRRLSAWAWDSPRRGRGHDHFGLGLLDLDRVDHRGDHGRVQGRERRGQERLALSAGSTPSRTFCKTSTTDAIWAPLRTWSWTVAPSAGRAAPWGTCSPLPSDSAVSPASAGSGRAAGDRHQAGPRPAVSRRPGTNRAPARPAPPRASSSRCGSPCRRA